MHSLSTGNFAHIAEKLFTSAGSRLPSPLEKRLVMDHAQRWANEAGTDRALRQALATKINFITFAELKSALGQVVGTLNELVTKERLTPAICTGYRMWSSNKWVYEGVKTALSFLPVAESEVPAMSPRLNAEFLNTILARNGDSIILFDDAIFSGQQIELEFANQLRMAVDALPQEAQKARARELRLIVAAAFSTNGGMRHALEACKSAGFPNSTIITSNVRIPTLSELFTPEQLDAIRRWKKHTQNASLGDLSLTLFEHGMPDDESSLSAVMKIFPAMSKPYKPRFAF